MVEKSTTLERCVLALDLAGANTALGQFLQRDGDHAIAARLLQFLMG